MYRSSPIAVPGILAVVESLARHRLHTAAAQAGAGGPVEIPTAIHRMLLRRGGEEARRRKTEDL